MLKKMLCEILSALNMLIWSKHTEYKLCAWAKQIVKSVSLLPPKLVKVLTAFCDCDKIPKTLKLNGKGVVWVPLRQFQTMVTRPIAFGPTVWHPMVMGAFGGRWCSPHLVEVRWWEQARKGPESQCRQPLKRASTTTWLHSIEPHTLKSLHHPVMPWAMGQAFDTLASGCHFRSRPLFLPVPQTPCRILALVSNPHFQEEMLTDLIYRAASTLSPSHRSAVVGTHTSSAIPGSLVASAGKRRWQLLGTPEKEILPLLPLKRTSFSREWYQVPGGKVRSSVTKEFH